MTHPQPQQQHPQIPNKPWPDLTTEQRIARVQQLTHTGLNRTDQATRLGLTLTALSQFCSANGLTAGNDNADSPWRDMSPEDKRTTVAGLLAEDYALREIADELGTTVGAVRAYCVREGLVSSTRRVRIDGPPMVPDDPVPEETWAALAGSSPVALMDLEDDQCRWPVRVGEQEGFCGCDVATGSYCAAHAKMARGR